LTTKAQQTYERIEALMADGNTKADAFTQLAEEYDQSVDSVRGAYYSGRRQSTGEPAERTSRPRRKRETTEHDAIGQAITTLRNAITAIHRDVDDARERADEAKREYEAISSAAEGRIKTIESKIEALGGEPAS
jgi:chromosome segregation ATPase